MTSRPASQPPSPSNSSVPCERPGPGPAGGRISRSTSVYRDPTEGFFVSRSKTSASTPQAMTSDYFDSSATGGASTGSGGVCTTTALPSTASADLANATIFLENTKYMEVIYDADRKRQYQALVRRYMNQLLYGCDRENVCTVPTCWTARKRLAGMDSLGGGVGKGRQLTVLSARIMACHLASRENPYEGLCPGRPVTVGLSFESNRKTDPPGKGKLRPPKPIEFGDNWRADQNSTKEVGAESIGDDEKENDTIGNVVALSNSAPKSAGNVQKAAIDRGARDTKSFNQMLFNTKPLRMLEWISMPPPLYPFRLGIGSSKPAEIEVKNSSIREPHSLRLDTSIKDSVLGQDDDLLDPFDDFDSNEAESPSEVVYHRSYARRVPTPPPLGIERRRDTLQEIVTPTSNSHMRGGINPSDPPQTPIAPPPAHQHRRPSRRDRAPDHTPTTQYHQSQFTEHFSGPPPPAPFHTPSRSSGNIFARNLDYNIPFGLLTPTDPSPHGSPEQFEGSLSTPPPQSLSHLNISLILSLVKICIDADIPPSKHAEAEAFAKQSIFYCLSCPEALKKSFLSAKPDTSVPEGTALDIDPMTTDKAFRIMTRKWETTVMKSMWQGLEDVFKYKSSKNGFGTPTQGNGGPVKNSQPRQHLLDDYSATRILVISLHVLAAMLPREGSYLPRPYAREEEWLNMRTTRGRGKVTLDIGDCFDNELAERLMKRVVRAFDYRVEQARLRTKPDDENPVIALVRGYLIKCAKAELELIKGDTTTPGPSNPIMAKFGLMEKKMKVSKNWSFAGCIVEWARAVVLKSWEGGEEVKKGTITAGGLNLMRLIYESKKNLYLDEDIFSTPIFADRLDPKDVPVQWFKSQRIDLANRNDNLHLLSHPFLFPPSVIVTYFRAINLHLMTLAYESALNALSLMRHVSLNDYFPETKEIRDRFVEDKLKIACTTYLLLGVRREYIMEDAFNAVYKRELRELVKPLKVKFLDSGEEGVDQGGPQYEFFNVLMKEVMSPEYGMFVDTDNVNHVNWFAIDQFEHLHKFELLGVLIGIAIYNGITLPVNFPMVFYKWMLEGVEDDPKEPQLELDDLEDGWPELVRGLRELLEWDDGDVEDIFVRTYEFSYNKCGGAVESIDMLKARKYGWKGLVGTMPPQRKKDKGKGKAHEDSDSVAGETNVASSERRNSNSDECEKQSNNDTSTTDGDTTATADQEDTSPVIEDDEEEAPMVTNANRVQFVHDYIHFLTRYSVTPQLLSLRKGLLTILPATSLQLLTPPKFKSLVEGIQQISIPLLQQITKYDDGYHANHPVIQELWQEVGKFTQDELKAFLEFVTASDRIPVNGLESLTFVVQRNGVDSDLLPTSMTCFGRLLLPEYKTGKGKVGERLKRALENSKGFGIV